MCTSTFVHGALRFHHGFHLAGPLELEPGLLGSNRDARPGSQQLQLWKRATFLGCQGSSYLYLVESKQSHFNDLHSFIIMSSTQTETHMCLNTRNRQFRPISTGFSSSSHETSFNSHTRAIHHFQSHMDCNSKECFGQCNGWRSLLYFMGCSSDALK